MDRRRRLAGKKRGELCVKASAKSVRDWKKCVGDKRREPKREEQSKREELPLIRRPHTSSESQRDNLHSVPIHHTRCPTPKGLQNQFNGPSGQPTDHHTGNRGTTRKVLKQEHKENIKSASWIRKTTKEEEENK